MIDLDKVAAKVHEKVPDRDLKGVEYSLTPPSYRRWLRDMVGHVMDSMKELGHYVSDRAEE